MIADADLSPQPAGAQPGEFECEGKASRKKDSRDPFINLKAHLHNRSLKDMFL